MAFRRSTISLLKLVKNGNLNKPIPFETSFLISQQFRMVSEAMENAKKRVALLTEDPGNDVKLKMYALFKQVNSFM